MTNGEVDRLERFLQQQMDRRFNDIKENINKLDQKTDELQKELLDSIRSVKTDLDIYKKGVEEKAEEERTWTKREIVTIAVGLLLGGGGITLAQILQKLLIR